MNINFKRTAFICNIIKGRHFCDQFTEKKVKKVVNKYILILLSKAGCRIQSLKAVHLSSILNRQTKGAHTMYPQSFQNNVLQWYSVLACMLRTVCFS